MTKPLDPRLILTRVLLLTLASASLATVALAERNPIRLPHGPNSPFATDWTRIDSTR